MQGVLAQAARPENRRGFKEIRYQHNKFVLRRFQVGAKLVLLRFANKCNNVTKPSSMKDHCAQKAVNGLLETSITSLWQTALIPRAAA